jgi:UDP-N-acetylglucosamine 2-epimerase (non-hydrolysing)
MISGSDLLPMSRSLKLLLVAGARPNFMKVAPLIHAIQRYNMPAVAGGSPASAVEYRLVHTGQHYDEKMSGVFFAELGIPAPDINLGVGSGSHAVQTANLMLKFEPVLEEQKPDWLVVFGDINSTVACTLVASKLGIKVAHVEAGLRSFDRTMPEEINRLVTDALADLLLTPSADANENLKNEGISSARIRLVGNIMIDALIANLEKARSSTLLRDLGLAPGSFAYVTLHRPSNVDDRESLTAIMSRLEKLAGELPVVFPMHPRTRKMCSQFGIIDRHDNGLKILEPIGYHDSISLTQNARLVLTDSGGLQEESTFFRTPCLTLRPNTERPVTISLGSNRLTSIDSLSEDLDRALQHRDGLGQVPPLWDGHAADRILQSLLTEAAG